MALSERQIISMGYGGVLLGLGLGNLITFSIAKLVISDFLVRSEPYDAALMTLGMSKEAFIDVLYLQQSYSLMMMVLSPVIAYMAPHVLAGALFIFLKLFVHVPDHKIEFSRVMECSRISLGTMLFYCIPAIGPLIALCAVAINLSRALYTHYKVSGFMKAMSIASALYVCFFISAASLQILAEQLTPHLK